MKTEVAILIYLTSVFTKKVDWYQLLSMVEANSKVEGTQGGKRKEQVKEPFHELEAFRFVSLRWSLFFSTQTTTGSSFVSKSNYLVKTLKGR